MTRPSPFVIELSELDRAELESRSRAYTAPHAVVLRAKVVLLAAGGTQNIVIAERLDVPVGVVARWRKRFWLLGIEGLADAKRSGRPRIYGHDERLAVVAAVTSIPPAPRTHWTRAALAERTGMSPSQVGRVLTDCDLKPHRVQGWLTRKDDPQFWARAADVCGLYLRPPEGALVLSLDEKTAMSARSPKHPTVPVAPGHPERKEFEYVRHGVVSLLAAFDVHTGQVLGREVERNDSKHFTAFLTEIDQYVHPDKTIHLVLDNGSSHVSKATQAWLAAHPRFRPHYTPTHSSWLNQVELWFSILTRQLIERGEFTSRTDMIDKIMDYIADYDTHAKPFKWTYDGTPLKVA